MPQHKICNALGMTRDRFEFIWRHFKISSPSVNDETNEISGDSGDEDDDGLLIEGMLECVVHDQEEETEEEITIEDEEDVSVTNKNVWFNKITPLANHVREVSLSLILSLGTVLSLDEMMICFCGRSRETHRLKNKPIGEGYKFFVLATLFGFVVNFTPDGRSAEKTGQQEYKQDKSIGKIKSMILFVTNVLNEIKERRLKRLREKQGRKTRSQNDDNFFKEDVNPMAKF